MDEAARILLDFFRKHHIQAGVVATLHTFGSQLEYNPHVH
ncbi:transposase [Enterococcus avium]